MKTYILLASKVVLASVNKLLGCWRLSRRHRPLPPFRNLPEDIGELVTGEHQGLDCCVLHVCSPNFRSHGILGGG